MYELHQDAASLPVYLYGVMIALGCALCWMTLTFTARREGLKDGTAVLTMLIALPLGLILSRLMFCLLDVNYRSIAKPADWLRLTDGGFGMFGALGGAMIAAIFAAGIMVQKKISLLAALMPGLFLFIFFERLGEGFVSGLGLSRSLIYDTFKNTFLAQSGEYDMYLRTWILEACFALVLFVVSLMILAHSEKPSHAFMKCLMLFGATQVLCESLRYDYHMTYSFVGVQHVLSMVALGVPVLIMGFRLLKRHKALSLMGIISIPVVTALCVFLEFRIDRHSDNRFMIYGIYTLLLCIPTVLGFMLIRRDRA